MNVCMQVNQKPDYDEFGTSINIPKNVWKITVICVCSCEHQGSPRDDTPVPDHLGMTKQLWESTIEGSTMLLNEREERGWAQMR